MKAFKTALVFLIILFFNFSLFSQFGTLKEVLNRGAVHDIGIAPPIGNELGFMYTNGSDEGVEIFRQKEEGQMFTGQSIPGFNELGFTHIDHADFDNDGDYDLVGVTDSDKLYMHLNQGGGVFDSLVLIHDVGSGGHKSKVCDWNGDGWMDIVMTYQSTSFAGDDHIIYTNNGDLTFAQSWAAQSPIQGSLADFIVGDFTNDGTDEFIYVNIDNELALVDTGGLFEAQEFPLEEIPGYFRGWTTTDLDEDGDIDLLISISDKVLYYENLLDHNFASPQVIIEGDFKGVSMNVIDIDADGDEDLLLGDDDNNRLILFEKNNGAYSNVFTKIEKNVQYPDCIVVEDFDGDNISDFALGTTADNFAILYRNDNGTLTREIMAGDFLSYNQTELADLDNDGDLEILPNPHFGLYFEANHQYTLRNTLAEPQDLDEDQFFEAAYADLNGDGMVDFVGAGYNCFTVYTNQNATFYPYSEFCGTGTKVWVVRLLDLNQDGFNDLVYYREKPSEFEYVVRYNDGNANFGDEVPLDICCNVYASNGDNEVLLKDLNNDGIQDLVVLNWRGVYYSEGYGNGNYGPSTVLIDNNDSDNHLFEKSIIDWDGDGDLDFIGLTAALGGNYGRAAVVKNNGNFQVDSREEIILTEMKTVEVGDGNGDGALDLIYVDENDKVYFQAMNAGLAVGDPVKIFNGFPSDNHLEIQLQDFENDGDLDIIVRNDNGRFAIGKNSAISVGIDESNELTATNFQNFKIHPNPNDGIFNLIFEEGFAPTNRSVITIYDTFGKLILSETLVEQAAINLSNLTANIYFVILRDLDGRPISQPQKLVIAK